MTSTLKKKVLRGQILNIEKRGVKFQINIIFRGELMNGDEVFSGRGNMQHIVKRKTAMRCMKARFANMTNVHTFAITSVNLILTTVALTRCNTV